MTGQTRQGNAGILDRLTLRYGPTPKSEPLSIRPGAMTVLVGPNNSGKSLLLREIHHHVCSDVRESREPSQPVPQPRSSRPDWRFPGEYRVLQECTPRLPATGPLRDLFAEEIRADFKDVEEEEEEEGDSFHRFMQGMTWAQAGDGAEKLQNFFQPLQFLGSANTQLRHFHRMVADELIDADAFCRVMKLEPGSLLARLLVGTAELGAGAVFQALQQNEQLDELVQLAKDGLDLARRFESYLSEPARFGELIEGGVVNLRAYRHVLTPFTVLLDGYSRLQQIEPCPIGSLYEEPSNYLTALHREREKLAALRKRVHDAFHFHLAIDILDMSHARFVAADTQPGELEYSLSPAALDYFKNARDLRDLSDGVRSFVGIHAALTSRDYRLILIDEPEAFLHPPLVRRLGHDLTRMAAERGASIIAATHSADFLMGCIEAGRGVNIVRLGYENNIATARSLPAEELDSMMRDPLLRSTGVLSALFHRAAVVCEGDTDGAFYGEINERLRLQAEDRGAKDMNGSRPYVRDAVFINAHSKQSVPRLMGALRRVGIPAVAIVDLDLLLDKDVVPDLLENAGANRRAYKPIGEWRSQLYEAFKELAKTLVPPLAKDADAAARSKYNLDVKTKTSKLIKRGGIKNLTSPQDQDAMTHFLDNLAHYGIFVPECGDLESWLPDISKGMGKSKDWLPEMFRRMGTVGQDNYVQPGDDDVWAFMRKIAAWIEQRLARPS